MTHYTLALFLHIIGVLGLFTAIGMEWMSLFRMRRVRLTVQVQEWSGVYAILGRVFSISAALILVSGLYLVHEAWGKGTAWTTLALIVLILLGAAGGGFIVPRLRAIHVAAEAAPAGAVPDSLRSLILDPILWATVQVSAALGFGVVYLMTIKPELGGSLLTVVVAAVIGLAVSQPIWRARPVVA
ncbi:MAG: DUF2269 family protein [Chloroflexota bacterium]